MYIATNNMSETARASYLHYNFNLSSIEVGCILKFVLQNQVEIKKFYSTEDIDEKIIIIDYLKKEMFLCGFGQNDYIIDEFFERFIIKNDNYDTLYRD